MRNIWILLLLPPTAWAAEGNDKSVGYGYDWKCNLYCFNNGVCRHGKNKFGSYAGVEETAELPWESEGHATIGMYCACPVGFTGLQCEIAMKVCGDDQHTCFNGAACEKEADKDGKIWWRCECDASNSVLTEKYAGKYCEHIATQFCNKGGLDPGNAYCTHGGKCKPKSGSGIEHAGCICEDGFEGKHCEIITATRQKTIGEYVAKASNSRMIGLIVGFVVAAVLAVTAVLYFRDKKERRSARRKRRFRNAGIETPDNFPAITNGQLT